MTNNRYSFKVEFNSTDWAKLTEVQQAIWVQQVANAIATTEAVVLGVYSD